MSEEQQCDRRTAMAAGAPSSIPTGDGTFWVDVSPLLHSACEELGDGELIHGENFSLFAAMSALEIMDPKMDSGMDNGKYFSIDEAIDSGAAPIPLSFNKTLDTLGVIDIMDHLLACEATWHKGHSLAQTVYSCLYLLRIDRTSSHALLHSYCRIIRATCNAVISVVQDARTHEEEDLFTMAYGLPLGGERDDRFLSSLNAVEETLCRQLRACKAPSANKMGVEDMEPLQTNLGLEEGFCRALLCRIRFRKHFYHILVSLRRPQGKGFELARKHIASGLLELEHIRKSAQFLKSVVKTICEDNGAGGETTASGCQAIGFDQSLNARSSAPAPPRSMKTLSWKLALEYFEKLLHDLDTICSFSLSPSLDSVLRFVAEFQKLQPDLVARAHLQVLLIHDGKLYGRDSLFSIICKAAAIPESMKLPDLQKIESIMQLGQFLVNLLKILCTNVAWQRRKLGKILHDWRFIYVQLEMAFRKEIVESSIMPNGEEACRKLGNHILTWVEEQTYWIASRFLFLGFELDLYSPHDYCMVYWYLYVVLIKHAEKSHLKSLAGYNTAKRKGKKKRDSVIDLAKDYQVPPSIQLIQCYICLAEGLYMMIAAIRNELKIFQTRGPFNSEHEIFLQHFEHLQNTHLPDHITYLSFKECTAQARFCNVVTYNRFKDAQRIAKELKNSFSGDPERMAELRRLEQVAEHNSVALNVISRLGALDPALKVTFEFSHHRYFATAVVKRS